VIIGQTRCLSVSDKGEQSIAEYRPKETGGALKHQESKNEWRLACCKGGCPVYLIDGDEICIKDDHGGVAVMTIEQLRAIARAVLQVASDRHFGVK